MTNSRVRLSVDEARDLAEGALRGIGYPEDDARVIADHVIDAALCGYEYSGLAKILNIPESEQFRTATPPHDGAARDRCLALPWMAETMSACWHSFTRRRRQSRKPPRTA